MKNDYYETLGESMAKTADALTSEDLFLTLSYAPKRAPVDFDTASNDMKCFIDAIRVQREARNEPCHFAYALRSMDGSVPQEYGMALSRGQETPEHLAALWPYGPLTIQRLGDLGAVSDTVRRIAFD